ncbi:MAG: hypothetical protein LBT08_00515 [Synergistaceae bacterium]|jgi:carboxypeptidase C (cathepsin A)|nr:hypothetical protein [Synergistaceae bacterium]
MENTADTEKTATLPVSPEAPEIYRSERSAVIKGATLKYTAEAGFMPISSDKGERLGKFFYVAYKKTGDEGARPRPISFIFNGGPGSASLMLHIDCLGPRTVDLGGGLEIASAPYRLIDNQETLLQISDLVFIDPIGTGYSKGESSEDTAKTFWGVESDAKSVCSFIRLYLTRNKLHMSPVYIVGESYGGIRAGEMAAYLQDVGIQPTGLVLVSPALSYQELIGAIGNDRPYVHTLPTMTNSAWYHKKLPQRLLSMSQEDAYQEAKAWAGEEYLSALWRGNELDGGEKRAIAEKHASYSGLSVDEILQLDLRVPLEYFAGNLLRDRRAFLGVYDTRCVTSGGAHCFEEDPSLFRAQLPAVSALMSVLTEEIGIVLDEEYMFSNKDIHPTWDFTTGVPKNNGRGGGYASSMAELSRSLRRNGQVKLMMVAGNYDLMCNRESSLYSLNHLDIPPDVRKKLIVKSYDGGHMFYTNPEAKKQFFRDLEAFYEE